MGIFKNAETVLTNKDEKLSKELSEYIKGTKIDVFIDNIGLVCSSKMPECKTIMGAQSYTDLKSITDRISNGLDKLGNLFNAIATPFYVITILSMYLTHPHMKSNFELNDDKKSYTVDGIDYIPVFVNSDCVSKLTHDELISVCLSTIFNHTQYVREMFRKADINSKWSYVLRAVMFGFMAKGSYDTYKMFDDWNKNDPFKILLNNNDPDKELFPAKEYKNIMYMQLIFIAISIIASYILNKIYYENSNLKSDNFVVKIGRGESLLSGLKKLKAEYEKNESTFSKLAKAASRFLGFYFDRKITDERISELENKSSSKNGEVKNTIDSKAKEVNDNFMEVVKSASDAIE